MVTSLLFVELYLQVSTGDLIKGHVERALSGNQYSLGVVVFIFIGFGNFKPESDLPGECLIFHEDGEEELFEFIGAEGLQVKEVDNDPEDLLQVTKSIAADVRVFVEKHLDFGRLSPDIIPFLGEDEDVVPGGLQDHFGVLH